MFQRTHYLDAHAVNVHLPNVQIFAAISAALLTAFLGNAILHRWQMRNWLAQQRYQGLLADVEAKQSFASEVVQHASLRLQKMRSLGRWLNDSRRADEELASYRAELTIWNSKLHEWFAKGPFVFSWIRTLELEQEVHSHFVKCGQELERLYRQSQLQVISNSDLSRLQGTLNRMAGRVDGYGRRLNADMERRKFELRTGRHLKYVPEDIKSLETKELVKLLFISDVDATDIIYPV